MIVQHHMIVSIAVHNRSCCIIARTLQRRIDGDVLAVTAIDEDQSLDRISDCLLIPNIKYVQTYLANKSPYSFPCYWSPIVQIASDNIPDPMVSATNVCYCWKSHTNRWRHPAVVSPRRCSARNQCTRKSRIRYWCDGANKWWWTTNRNDSLVRESAVRWATVRCFRCRR